MATCERDWWAAIRVRSRAILTSVLTMVAALGSLAVSSNPGIRSIASAATLTLGVVLADAVIALDEEGELEELGARARSFVEPATWSNSFAAQLRACREVLAARSEGRAIEPGVHAP